VFFIHVACLGMCVLFYFSFVCLHVCAYAFKSKVHYESAFGPGAFGLPYNCTPPVCVPAVLGGLAVWRHNNIQKKKQRSGQILTKLGFHFFLRAGGDGLSGFITTNKQTNKLWTKNQITKSLMRPRWLGVSSRKPRDRNDSQISVQYNEDTHWKKQD